MEKIKIGITQGDSNSVTYELIYRALEDPTMMELCVPVVYGRASAADFYRKELETETKLMRVRSAEEAKEGRAYLVEGDEKNIRVDMGNASESSMMDAQESLRTALKGLQEGETDVLVTSSIDEAQMRKFHPEFAGEESVVRDAFQMQEPFLGIWMTEDLKLNSMQADTLSLESLLARLKALDQVLKKDFLLSHSRIAILVSEGVDEDGIKETVQKAAMEALESGIFAFGPFQKKDFLENREYTHYDCVLAIGGNEEVNPFETVTDKPVVIYRAGLPFVWTSPVYANLYKWVGKGVETPNALQEAMFWAKDILSNRRAYEEAHTNPLGKLYHDRRDEKRNNVVE